MTSNVYDESGREVTLKAETGVKWEHKRRGHKRPIAEGKSGHESSKNTSKYPDGVYKTQTIDREMDKYSKTVIDKRTGEVVKDLHEPLSQHRSRRNSSINRG
jgi:hypothetical protein